MSDVGGGREDEGDLNWGGGGLETGGSDWRMSIMKQSAALKTVVGGSREERETCVAQFRVGENSDVDRERCVLDEEEPTFTELGRLKRDRESRIP